MASFSLASGRALALLGVVLACSAAENDHPSGANGGSSGSQPSGGSSGTRASGGSQGKSGAAGVPGTGGTNGGSGTTGGGSGAGSGGTTTGGSAGTGTGGGGTGGGGTGGTAGGVGSGGTAGKAGGGGGGTGGASGSAGTAGTAGSTGDAGTQRGCKRGVAYGQHSEADMRVLSPGVRWWYNWTYQPDGGVRSGAYRTLGVEYVPMVWGQGFNVENIVRDVPQGSRFLLGFNEPNFFSQANMTAARAAQLWPQVQSIADRRSLLLVSPAVNFCGGGCHDTDPFRYLQQFFAACQGCRVDHIAIHIYVGCNGGTNRAQYMINHINTYKSRFTQPLWLTEFACDNAATLEDQRRFMVDALTFLENDPRIYRYSWFSGRTTAVRNANLLAGSGVLTALGEAYVNHPHNAACTP